MEKRSTVLWRCICSHRFSGTLQNWSILRVTESTQGNPSNSSLSIQRHCLCQWSSVYIYFTSKSSKNYRGIVIMLVYVLGEVLFLKQGFGPAFLKSKRKETSRQVKAEQRKQWQRKRTADTEKWEEPYVRRNRWSRLVYIVRPRAWVSLFSIWGRHCHCYCYWWKVRRKRKETMAVNKCVKYLLFFFNLLFWVSPHLNVSFQTSYIFICLGLSLTLSLKQRACSWKKCCVSLRTLQLYFINTTFWSCRTVSVLLFSLEKGSDTKFHRA